MSKYILLILVLFLASCEQYFVPDIDAQESSLVFEGFITDQANSHLIKISRSISFNEDSIFINVVGFNVIIEDELGARMQLFENRPGYYTTESNVKGSIGTKYRMVAVSPEGKTYNSQWELLEASAPIDSIYGTYAEEVVLNYNEYMGYEEENIPGMNILNNVDAKGFSSFYRYEYNLVFQSTNYYPTSPFETLVYIARPVKSIHLDFISIVNGNLYGGNNIINNKVQFVSEYSINVRTSIDSMERDSIGNYLFEEDQIRFQQLGYLIQLNQYSLSESGFGFWDAIYRQSNSSGQVFDAVDSQIKGNISNLADPNEIVFGYFGASAVTQKAVYLNLGSNKQVSVKPVIYFPNLTAPIASLAPYDFWVN